MGDVGVMRHYAAVRKIIPVLSSPQVLPALILRTFFLHFSLVLIVMDYADT